MKKRSNDREHGLQLVAAAVMFALGSATAIAQQPGSEQQPGQIESGIESGAQEVQDEARGAADAVREGAADAASEAQEEGSELGAAVADEESSGGSADLDQLVQEHDDLSTFVEALQAAGMTESLTSGTNYTVFAPTNDAFEQMSGMSTEELMQPENRERLISLLRAHIVADDVDEELAQTLNEAQTIDGGSISIDASSDPMRVGDASVVDSGIQAGNLRVYAIDQVLSPGTELARADDAGASSDDAGASSEDDSGASDIESDSPLGSEEPGAGIDLGSESDTGLESELEERGSELEDRGSELESEIDRSVGDEPGSLGSERESPLQ